jgi:hypothetical protein
MESLVPLKNNLLIDSKTNVVKRRIIERINELGLVDLHKYKNDNEFLVLVANLIENLITKKDSVSKKQLLIEVYKQLFGISEEEANILSNNIEFICNQKGLVKKMSYYKLFMCNFKEYFFKKR